MSDRPRRDPRRRRARVLVLFALGVALVAPRPASARPVLLLDASAPRDQAPQLVERLADYLVYDAGIDVVDDACLDPTEIDERERDQQEEVAALLDRADRQYDDFDADGAWISLQEASRALSNLDPLANGPLCTRLCRSAIQVAIERGDQQAVDDHLVALIAAQPWFEPPPGTFDPATDARFHALRAQLEAEIVHLDFGAIDDDVQVTIDGFAVKPDTEVVLAPGIHLVTTERDGYLPVRREIRAGSGETIELEAPTSPRWDADVRRRLRHAVQDDDERAFTEGGAGAAVRRLLDSCGAERALIVVAERGEEEAELGLLDPDGVGWDHLGSPDRGEVPERAAEALAEEVEVSGDEGPRGSSPHTGVLAFTIGPAVRIPGGQDLGFNPLIGGGLDAGGGVRVLDRFHIGGVASVSFLTSLGSPATWSSVLYEDLLVIDAGAEVGPALPAGRSTISLLGGGGFTTAVLFLRRNSVQIGGEPFFGGWVGAALGFELYAGEHLKIGPTIRFQHAFAPLYLTWTNLGSDGEKELDVTVPGITQARLVLTFTVLP